MLEDFVTNSVILSKGRSMSKRSGCSVFLATTTASAACLLIPIVTNLSPESSLHAHCYTSPDQSVLVRTMKPCTLTRADPLAIVDCR